jgi:hypothetical protein
MATATAIRPTRFVPSAMLAGPAASSERTPAAGVAAAEVCDLIEAAGPLTVRDIAGGLAVSVRQASASVQLMVRRNCLKQDEFRRYRLCGTCTDR